MIVKTDFTHPTFKVLLLWLPLKVEVLDQDYSNGRLNYTTSTVSTLGRSAVAAPVGDDPTAFWLTARRSTAELQSHIDMVRHRRLELRTPTLKV